jgi:hypothetical protein
MLRRFTIIRAAMATTIATTATAVAESVAETADTVVTTFRYQDEWVRRQELRIRCLPLECHMLECHTALVHRRSREVDSAEVTEVLGTANRRRRAIWDCLANDLCSNSPCS